MLNRGPVALHREALPTIRSMCGTLIRLDTPHSMQRYFLVSAIFSLSSKAGSDGTSVGQSFHPTELSSLQFQTAVSLSPTQFPQVCLSAPTMGTPCFGGEI